MDRQTSPRLPLAEMAPFQAQSSWEQASKDKHEADQFVWQFRKKKINEQTTVNQHQFLKGSFSTVSARS